MFYIIFYRFKIVALFLAIKTYLHQLRTTTVYLYKTECLQTWNINMASHLKNVNSSDHALRLLSYTFGIWAHMQLSVSFVCACVCLCAYLCVYVYTYLISHRSEDHCWRFDPVGEEAVRCDDPHRVLPQCLCPHWSAALHGKSAAQVCHLAHQHHRNVPQ